MIKEELEKDKFANALCEVFKMLVPTIHIHNVWHSTSTFENEVTQVYIISGYDAHGQLYKIKSDGFILDGKGRQLTLVYPNCATQYIPFYAFNWAYLGVR